MSFSVLEIIKDEIFGQADYVSEETFISRNETCYNCDKQIKGPGKYGKVCSLCGCLTAIKSRYTRSSCPDSPPRW